MNPDYPVVAGRGRHRCEYCRAPEAVFNFPFEVEHVTPCAHGGENDHSNPALACRACNLNKLDHLCGRDEVTGLDVPLFNPRQDVCADHFQVNQSGTVVGLTPVGRATVARL